MNLSINFLGKYRRGVFIGMHLLSLMIFVANFYFPAYSTTTGYSDGLALLLTGWMGLFIDPAASLSWLANPLYFMSLYGMIKKRDINLLFLYSLLSVVFSLLFLCVKSVISDEGGNERLVISYHLGYWLWVLAPLILMISQYIEIKTSD
jgi:hypothetical protein